MSDCSHPCPVAVNGRGEYWHGKPEYAEWDEWNDSHPRDATGERICTVPGPAASPHQETA